ncbi:hypothetical protein ACIBSW_24875 [Actinoplanes sp. NPDC049668]|uniref:hypothetical protein n=1 Tax=unclassified Actinoplanes TaxID=2626549 RepID=UPI0033A1386F
MASPAPPDHQGQPSIARLPAPDDVTDPLLWTCAADVAAAHRQGPDGTCTNLQCRGQRAPCAAACAAYRAAQLARADPGTAPVHQPPPARGRATVPTGPSGFAALVPAPATPRARPAPKSVFASFRRPGVRAADPDIPEVRP